MVSTTAAVPHSCDHVFVLWFPQRSACASWFLLALRAECEKILCGRLCLEPLGRVPPPAFHSWVHWHEGRLWNGIKTTLGNHREKAHFWLASHPALKSQRQGFKEQRNSGEEISFPLVSPTVGQLEALHTLLLKETKAMQQGEVVPSDFLSFPEIRGYRENTNGI